MEDGNDLYRFIFDNFHPCMYMCLCNQCVYLRTIEQCVQSSNLNVQKGRNTSLQENIKDSYSIPLVKVGVRVSWMSW